MKPIEAPKRYILTVQYAFTICPSFMNTLYVFPPNIRCGQKIKFFFLMHFNSIFGQPFFLKPTLFISAWNFLYLFQSLDYFLDHWYSLKTTLCCSPKKLVFYASCLQTEFFSLIGWCRLSLDCGPHPPTKQGLCIELFSSYDIF